MNQHTQSTSPAHEEAEDHALMAQTRSVWPRVIGIIGLLYGLMGLMCNLFSQGWVLASDFIPEQMRGGMSFPPAMKLVSGVSLVAALILSVLLISGSIGTLRHKRGGPRLIRAWAIGRMALLLLGAIAAVALAPAMVDAARAQHEYFQNLPADQRGPWIPSGPFDEAGAHKQQLLMTGVFTLATAIMPLTLGLYLSRKKIKDEVNAWV